MNRKEIVRTLWRLFSNQDWEASKTLIHQEFEAFWPQSNEKFKGADNFVGMNEEYPGHHVAEIRHLLEDGDTVVCTVFISADTGQTAYATSFFKFSDDKIIRATEYWGDEYPAPESRKKWTV